MSYDLTQPKTWCKDSEIVNNDLFYFIQTKNCLQYTIYSTYMDKTSIEKGCVVNNQINLKLFLFSNGEKN